MKTNIKELRLGNLLQTINGDLTIVTDLITNHDKDSSCFWCFGYHSNEVEPIKMTDEYWRYVGENESILVDKTGFVIFKNGYAYQFIFSDYPFFHQVQNLYFNLTGSDIKALEAKK